MTHQGYIEPHSCLASVDEEGKGTVWCSTQGHFEFRNQTASILKKNIADLKFVAKEIGGGFGGKTVVYLEPLAVMLSEKAGRPVKMTMTREEVFRATVQPLELLRESRWVLRMTGKLLPRIHG